MRIFQHMTTSKLKPYQRGREGEGEEGWQIEGEAQREVGETERESGRMANRQPHQTTHVISERWMREVADSDSSPPQLSKFVFFFCASLTVCLSFIFWLPNSHLSQRLMLCVSFSFHPILYSPFVCFSS